MRGACGDFVSVTWPGYVGVLTAMAPQRFAAALNQAPMRRRTRHRWLRPYDFAANALNARSRADRIPPDQLLRRAFELCEDFAAARRLLESTPVARPAIYTLVGCAAHERCVIERTETGCVTREENTCAANDWVPARPGWEGRIGTRRFLVSSFADAAGYSRARRDALAEWSGAAKNFDWLRPPVLNPYTRLAVAMSPANGILRAIGYDIAGAELARAGDPDLRTRNAAAGRIKSSTRITPKRDIANAHDHQRGRHPALLRRGGRRHARRVRPRVRRRLPHLGTADARLRALASLRHLFRARLSAFGRAERSGALRSGHRPRRRHRRHGCARHRSRACGRPFHGRLHGAACRHQTSAALHLGDGSRLRLGLGGRSRGARGDAPTRGGYRQDVYRERTSPRRRRSMPTARRGRRTSTRTRAAMRNSPACSPSIRRSATR